jgi:hypothetical protein
MKKQATGLYSTVCPTGFQAGANLPDREKVCMRTGPEWERTICRKQERAWNIKPDLLPVQVLPEAPEGADKTFSPAKETAKVYASVVGHLLSFF